MIESGVEFIYNGHRLITWMYNSADKVWLCRDIERPYRIWLRSCEIIDAIKEEMENIDKMKLEYKFYEKNLAPKWLEGDYDLHIEGNRMTMTSKDGKKVETRCHPEDDWLLQVGIDELKERMTEVKKPREIKVGDKVKFVFTDFYNPNKLCDFFDTAAVATYDILKTTSTALSGRTPSRVYRYEVLYVGDHLDNSINKNVRVALVRHNTTDTEFVVRLEKLELVE